jgi:hypothetical protein
MRSLRLTARLKKHKRGVNMLNVNAYNKQIRQEYEKEQSIELLEKYVLSETLCPIEDFGNAVKIIRANYGHKISCRLLIIGAYLFSVWCLDETHNELLAILNEMYPHLSAKEQAIVCYLNANHLRHRDRQNKKKKERERYLLQSLEYEGHFVYNRVMLAELYTGEKAKKMYREAVEHIVTVDSLEDIHKITIEQFVDPQFFIDEHILGIRISDSNYETLMQKQKP